MPRRPRRSRGSASPARLRSGRSPAPTPDLAEQSGINAFLHYLNDIFSRSSSALWADVQAIIIGVVNGVFTFVVVLLYFPETKGVPLEKMRQQLGLSSGPERVAPDGRGV